MLAIAVGVAGCGGGAATLPMRSSAVESVGGRAPLTSTGAVIYVADAGRLVRGARKVTEYDASADGNAAPIRTIEGPHTRLQAPAFVAVDGSGQLYVVNYNFFRSHTFPDVAVFAPGANGDATPVRKIWLGPSSPSGPLRPFIAADATGYLYVANERKLSIDVYAPDAHGTPLPVRSIHGPHTHILNLFGVSVDSQGDIIATGYIVNHLDTPRVLVFRPNANGNVAPAREIRGLKTQLFGPGQAAVDAAGDLYVNDNVDTFGRVLVFAPGANGNVAPIRIIYPENPTFIDGIALNGNELFASQVYTPARSLAVYPADANGVTQPLRTIAGSRTMLSKNLGTIAVHSSDVHHEGVR